MNISFTEIAAWKTCRQRWYFKYGLGIEPRRYASYIDLGTLCHAGLEAVLRKRGFFHTFIWDKMKELLPENAFDEEKQEAVNLAELASKVVARYFTQPFPYSAIAVEQEFDVRIPGRRDHVVGRFDSILRDEQGYLWLAEWKFPRSFRTEEDVELSTQLAIYQWAAHRVGYPVVGILYNQILPRLPEIPAQNKNGSTSRREIYTDWETYKTTVLERGDDPEDYRDEMFPKLLNKEFWRTYRIYRSPQHVEAYVRELKRVAGDIAAKNKRIYTCENPIHCSGCAYRNLCLEDARGNDYKPLINTAYKQRATDNDSPTDTTEHEGGFAAQ